MRVKFRQANKTFRGDFKPGDQADVNERRARIWAEAGVVEILDAHEPKTAPAPVKKAEPARGSAPKTTGGQKG